MDVVRSEFDEIWMNYVVCLNSGGWSTVHISPQATTAKELLFLFAFVTSKQSIQKNVISQKIFVTELR